MPGFQFLLSKGKSPNSPYFFIQTLQKVKISPYEER